MLSKHQVIDQLKDANVHLNEYAKTLLNSPHFDFEPSEDTYKLAKVGFSELNLEKPTHFKTIQSKASELGLGLCPLFIGAMLRLEYKEQPIGPYLTVASERPVSNCEYPAGLYLRRYEGHLWLRGFRYDDDYLWPVENEFVFLLN